MAVYPTGNNTFIPKHSGVVLCIGRVRDKQGKVSVAAWYERVEDRRPADEPNQTKTSKEGVNPAGSIYPIYRHPLFTGGSKYVWL